MPCRKCCHVAPAWFKNPAVILAGPQSAEILERLMADPDSFVLQDLEMIEELEIDTASTAPTAGHWAALSNSTRFFLAVACLKFNLAWQRKALGSN